MSCTCYVSPPTKKSVFIYVHSIDNVIGGAVFRFENVYFL